MVLLFIEDWPDRTSGNTCASGAEGKGIKPQADQASYSLPATRRTANFKCDRP